MPLSPSTSAVAGAGLRHRDVRPRVEAAGLEAAHILRQAEDAVAVGAGEIGLRHQSAQRAASAAGNPAATNESSIIAVIARAGTRTKSESSMRHRPRRFLREDLAA